MLPQRRLGRGLLVVVLATLLTGAALFTSVPFAEPEQDRDLALAPVVADTDNPTRTVPAEAAQVERVARPSGETQFERVLRPLLLEARRHRQTNAAADPVYWTRVSPRLNATRLNFLLFGYGETHEPPLTERAFIGSLTIFSYDYARRQIDLVSVTHDIRAPEIERYLQAQGQRQVGPIKIDGAYRTGGFDLMRRTLEDATGLAIDFQLAFRESAISVATDSVFGGIEVDVPRAFKVNAFYLDGSKYPAGQFSRGPQRLNGVQVIQFIKTVPVEERYDPALEHNARKHLVFRSLMDALRGHADDVAFLGRCAMFFGGQVAHDSIAYDFDLRTLIVENLRGAMADVGHHEARDAAVPGVQRTVYVVDPASGDGGVQWVQANAYVNGVTQRDIAQHRYKELAMEVPYSGDPYAADLVASYWPDVRRLVASRLAD